MPFIPLEQPAKATDPAFSRVSDAEQVARDVSAERLVRNEFEQDMPEDSRDALELEYRHRFEKEPPIAQTPEQPLGFVPLANLVDQDSGHGFIPLAEAEQKRGMSETFAPAVKTMKAIGQVYPVAETATNLITQGAALPIAGIAGLGAAATKAMGLTDTEPADVVHSVAGALTYQPRTDLGRHLTQATMVPFEKLAEAGQWAGGKTLEATDSPVAATAVDTAINALPMVVAPIAKSVRGRTKPIEAPTGIEPAIVQEAAGAAEAGGAVPMNAPTWNVRTSAAARGLLNHHNRPSPQLLQRLLGVPEDQATAFFNAWMNERATKTTGAEHAPSTSTVSSRVQRLGVDETALPESGKSGLEALRRTGDQGLPALDREFQSVPGGRGAEATPEALVGAAERERGLRTDELPVARSEISGGEPANVSQGGVERGASEHRGSGTAPEYLPEHLSASTPETGYEYRASAFIPEDAARRAETDLLQRQDAEHIGLGARDRNSSEHTGGPAVPVPDRPGPSIDPRPVVRDSIARAERILNERSSIAGWIDHYNRHVNDGQIVESFRRNADGSHSLRVSGGQTTRTVKVPEADLSRYLDVLRDPAKVAEIESRNANDAVLGRKVRELDDTTLGKWKGMASLSDVARAKLEREFKRRNAELVTSEGVTTPVTTDSAARIMGRALTEFDDAALARMAKGKTFSDSARTKAQAEIDRRAAIESEMPADGTVNAFAPGARYTGFIDDTPRPGTGNAGTAEPTSAPAKISARPEPIRREDVLIPFMKALDTGIYEGRVKGKSRLGFFRPRTEEVRIKRHADLETASHELAHLLDKRIPEIRKAWESDKAMAKELKGISYDAGKVYEGFAEGVRLWMTQPDVAKAKAPLFSKWFEEFTNRHEYGPAIKKAQAGMTEWFGQDAVDRARSKIGDHAPLSDALNGGWDRWRQSVVDDLHGVYRMEREKTGGIAPAGAYETARLARASHSIADGALRFGAPAKRADGSFSWKGKGLEEILKPIAANMDDAMLYFVGRSARELMTQGREHLFTPGEVDGMLRLKRPEFDQAFKDYQEWNKGVLDFAEAHGVINPEARALWQRTQYLPFHRVGQPGRFKGKPGDWSGVKALTGGTENIRDILGNMTSNAAQLIDKAVKNEARQKIAELAEKADGGGKFMVRIPAESRPVRIDSKQAVDALLKSMGVDSKANMTPATANAVKALRKELENAPAMLELMQPNMPPAGGNVVAVLKGGKPVWYEVADPLLYRALSSIDRPLQSAVVKWLGIPKRIGQMTITLTPDFMLANIARDTVMGSVMSRTGFRPVIDSLNGMRLRLTNDPIYKDYIANGGGMSSMFLDETRFRAKLERFYQRQGIDYRTVLDAPAKIGNFLETLADSFEMSTRLGEYKRAIDAGEHPRHAAYLGRDVSTDFAMKGDSTAAGFMFDTVMFLRPALVSWDRLYRGIAHDPNKMAIAAKTGTLAMMSAALYMLNKDEPRYRDLPDWDRDTNWHFFVGDQHYRYPKIWEIGAVASVAERTTEKLLNEDPQGLGKDFTRILGNTFNINWKPQIVAPLYDQATNRNSFTTAPIETPGMENLQPFLRAKPTTSETMKALGMATKDLPESLQVNPVRAEALLRGYFNTWAMYGLMLTDKAFFGDKLPEMRADQMPVVRRFYSQEPPQHTKFETQFYDLLGEAKRLHGSIRELDRLGRPDIADAKEKDPLATEAKPLERAAKNLAGINKDMAAVRRDGSLSPEEKRQRLDALTVERNDLLKRAVVESKAAREERKE